MTQRRTRLSGLPIYVARIPAAPFSLDLGNALGLDDVVADGVANQARDRVELEFTQNGRAMRLGCANADTKCIRNFFVTSAFGQELQNFPLPHAESLSYLRSARVPF